MGSPFLLDPTVRLLFCILKKKEEKFLLILDYDHFNVLLIPLSLAFALISNYQRA